MFEGYEIVVTETYEDTEGFFIVNKIARHDLILISKSGIPIYIELKEGQADQVAALEPGDLVYVVVRQRREKYEDVVIRCRLMGATEKQIYNMPSADADGKIATDYSLEKLGSVTSATPKSPVYPFESIIFDRQHSEYAKKAADLLGDVVGYMHIHGENIFLGRGSDGKTMGTFYGVERMARYIQDSLGQIHSGLNGGIYELKKVTIRDFLHLCVTGDYMMLILKDKDYYNFIQGCGK